jgi:hypothetical protein
MTTDQSMFLTAVNARLSSDGAVAQLEFLRANGKSAYVDFPAAATGTVLLNIEQALGRLFEMQRAALRGQDPRAFFAIGAKHVEKIQGAVAQGKAVVSFALKSNVRLDFALDRTQVRGLIDWLQEVEKGLDRPPGPKN